MQGKPALNRCTTRMSCRWGVASTCISLRCILCMLHIMYICIYIYLYIYIFIYLCIAYISSHPKGPEQDQLRSPFVPYVRNTAERSIHNFDSGPNLLIVDNVWWFGGLHGCPHFRKSPNSKIRFPSIFNNPLTPWTERNPWGPVMGGFDIWGMWESANKMGWSQAKIKTTLDNWSFLTMWLFVHPKYIEIRSGMVEGTWGNHFHVC